MPHLILVKHALPEIIPALPANQWHLSEVGRAQCTALAGQLGTYAPAALVSSSEPKALETAHLVAQRMHTSVQVVDGLYVARATGLEPFTLWKRLGLPSFVVLTFPQYEIIRVVEKMTLTPPVAARATGER